MYNNTNCKSNFFPCLELRPAALFQYENQFCPLRVTEMNSQSSRCDCVRLPLQACRDFLDLAETHSRRWQRALQYEREQRTHLEETIEQLAKQHNSLERAWREAPTLVSSTPSATTANKGESDWLAGWLCVNSLLNLMTKGQNKPRAHCYLLC